MKRTILLGKRWRKESPGFTLAELMVTMAVGGFIVAAVFTVMTQLFHLTAINSNYMAAFRQVQNGGDWISRDALMAQQVYDMALVTLTSDVDPGDSEIPVVDDPDDSSDGTAPFPPAGVICIGDELVQYESKTIDRFIVATGSTATAHHGAGENVTSFITLGWIDWYGSQHMVVYNLKEPSHHLMRSYLTRGAPEDPYNLVSSTLIAQTIDIDYVDYDKTRSTWSYEEKELTVDIASTVGDFVMWKTNIWEATATRTYKVNPRPFF